MAGSGNHPVPTATATVSGASVRRRGIASETRHGRRETARRSPCVDRTRRHGAKTRTEPVTQTTEQIRKRILEVTIVALPRTMLGHDDIALEKPRFVHEHHGWH